jgi:hypothetical protein
MTDDERQQLLSDERQQLLSARRTEIMAAPRMKLIPLARSMFGTGECRGWTRLSVHDIRDKVRARAFYCVV